MTRPAFLRFRPHHFFCTLGFQGKGYSDGFVKNYAALISNLTDGTPIRVTGETDDICMPCPHRRDHLCTQQTKIQRLDDRHARALKLKPGDIVTWGEAKQKLSELSLKDHAYMCEGCQWREFGMCAKALLDLKKQAIA